MIIPLNNFNENLKKYKKIIELNPPCISTKNNSVVKNNLPLVDLERVLRKFEADIRRHRNRSEFSIFAIYPHLQSL